MTLPGQNHNVKKKSERYTPPWIVEIARAAMGGIDLDPCSCEEAQRTVQAKEYYSLEKGQDGLAMPWRGNVFVNPPGGKFDGNGSTALRWYRAFLGYRVISRRDSTAQVFVGFNLQLLPAAIGVTDRGSTMFWYLTKERPHFYEPGTDPNGKNSPYGHSFLVSTVRLERDLCYNDRRLEEIQLRPW